VTRFAGTAAYYARFRPGYPPAFFELLRERYGLDGTSRVLDLATGTGLLALPLAAFVGEVVAVDLDREMLAELEAVAPSNLSARFGRAEELGPELGHFRLATIGRAFHWFERDTVLARLHEISDGVVLAGDAMSTGEPWLTLAAVAGEFVGDRRPKHTGETWTEVIARSAYRTSERRELPVTRHWSLEDVIGYAFSLSWASHALLGERAGEFERTLRDRLGPGPWVEHAIFEVLLAP
jgi:SAM-dependent methyltransferase